MLEISFTFLFNCAHQIFNFKKKMITQDDKPPVQNPHQSAPPQADVFEEPEIPPPESQTQGAENEAEKSEIAQADKKSEEKKEVTNSELLTSLKQKTKDLKKVEKKLEKVEEAYKAAVKTRKQLQADKDALIAFVEIVMRGQKKVDLKSLEQGSMKTDDLLALY